MMFPRRAFIKMFGSGDFLCAFRNNAIFFAEMFDGRPFRDHNCHSCAVLPAFGAAYERYNVAGLVS